MQFSLGPEKRELICKGFYVLIDKDLRKCVVFLGHEDDPPRSISYVGTGFCLGYKDIGYLVTVKHVALRLGGDPFVVRINLKVGSYEDVKADEIP